MAENVATYKKWLHFVVRIFGLHFEVCYISGCNKPDLDFKCMVHEILDRKLELLIYEGSELEQQPKQ